MNMEKIKVCGACGALIRWSWWYKHWLALEGGGTYAGKQLVGAHCRGNAHGRHEP